MIKVLKGKKLICKNLQKYSAKINDEYYSLIIETGSLVILLEFNFFAKKEQASLR